MDTSTILHPTDFSEHSAAALRFASELAQSSQGKLLIVHVAFPAEPATVVAGAGIGTYPVSGVSPVASGEGDDDLAVTHETLEEKLNAVTPLDPGLAFEHRLLIGEPADEIVKAAEDGGADQIVMGSHGRRGLSRMLMGSVAESVLRKASCPVTIVKLGGD